MARPFLGAGQDDGAVSFHHRLVLSHLILVISDQDILIPDGRSHRTIGIDRITRPVSTGVQQVEPARIGHADHLKSKLAGQQSSGGVLGTMISPASVKQENTRLISVRADGNLGRVFGLIHCGSNIPVHSQGLNTENVFPNVELDVGPGQNFIGGLEDLVPGDC